MTHITDRFGLPEASYQDAMEMGNSLARAVVASPDDFEFDERVLCRAFCLSAKEEILATQRWDTAAAERDAIRSRNAELVEALMKAADTFRDFAMADRALGKPLRAAASEVAENATREVIAKVTS